MMADACLGIRRCRGRFRRVSLTIARHRGQAAAHGRWHRRAHRRGIPRVGCDGIVGRRLWPAASDFRRASGEWRQRYFALAHRQSIAAEVLRRPRSLGGQYPQQRRRDAALGARTGVQVADRRDVELPYAARHRGIVARDARDHPDPVCGRRRQMARGTLVEQWRNLAPGAIGVCQIRRRRGAGASGGCGLRRHARGQRFRLSTPRQPATAQAN